jgi:spore coat polysaccharide biosynthesis protein SpsF
MIIIVQARYSSVRLPGKILRELLGKPLLAWTLQRLRLSSLCSEVVVATSLDGSDDVTEDFCERFGIRCFRGPLANVAKRLEQVASAFQVSGFVRISGDSPMIDPRLVDQAINEFQLRGSDLVTNVQKRTYPKGQSVEVLNAYNFRGVVESLCDHYDQEHVTSFYYKNSDCFRIFNFESGADLGNLQLSIDTEEDFGIIKQLMARVDPTLATWQELVEELSKIKNIRSSSEDE